MTKANSSSRDRLERKKPATSSRASSSISSPSSDRAASPADGEVRLSRLRRGAEVLASDLACSIEQLDDPICKAREITQRANEVFARSNDSLIELYIHGHMGIAIRCVDVGPPYYGAILEARPNGGHLKPRTELGGRRADGPWNQTKIDKPLMLAHNVQVMQSDQHQIPSAPRFETFDDRAFPIGKRLYCFTSLIAFETQEL